MKKILIAALLLVSWPSLSFAFLYDDVQFMTKEEIQKLPDAELYELYVKTKVDEKASQEFHISAGFSNKKEYQERKRLIRLLFDIRTEMSSRPGLDPQKVDDNLK